MKALDLFAGSGWGVACQQLGIEEYGVEIMPAALETRKLNGMETVYNDVWDIAKAEGLDFDLLIASPPCQTFSTAGQGSGRKALDDVLAVLHDFPYGDMDKLRSYGERFGDDRTALVLSPLEYIHRFRPKYVAMEQVPTVLPVWKALAKVLQGLGYSVWTDNVHAEQFGVPQTRKRAILLASRVHEVTAPKPTHSKYYPQNPQKLDPGVLPWETIRSSLGSRVIPSTGMPINYLKLGKQRGQAIRYVDQPAMTVCFGNDSATPRWFSTLSDARSWVSNPHPEIHLVIARFTSLEAKQLQSFPESFQFGGTKTAQFLQIGNAVPPKLANAMLSHLLNK